MRKIYHHDDGSLCTRVQPLQPGKLKASLKLALNPETILEVTYVIKWSAYYLVT